ncbi:Type I Iterative PKS [Diaporthe eres]|uniref:Type I Iterative PKS n=1 Tax=Diaporthe eres TaxID=83184 RepID=A0ABR1NWH4_DIAER
MEFQLYGAVALRLAALIGALVDAEDADGPNGPSKSFSLAWSQSAQKQKLDEILDDAADAYISVQYDNNRATITTAAGSFEALQQRLQNVGTIAAEIPLIGRFHCSRYEDDIQDVLSLCDATPGLQLPDADQLQLSSYSTTDSKLIKAGKLHHIALRGILLDTCHWWQTFESMLGNSADSQVPPMVLFGLEKCVPPSMLRHVNDQITYMPALKLQDPSISSLATPRHHHEDEIAVVGMACKVAGADDVDELWDIMCKGESQHVEVPEDRFTFDTHWRDKDNKRKWYGNFVRDHDAFDHKFFKKSPREVTSQDPQQRLFLQSAYQAVEQSGYFNSAHRDPRVGVFVGVCAADYEANIACYAPNAFSATGNLKSFIAGKISHYFGWTGPGLTIDTACSASAVAIHQACRSILGGECTAALAGGTNIMTSPLWFQNLAGASFLSPTGACKPFDAAADGYCRGEAVASVFLKKMSQAIADGDQIIGTIRSTAVMQNENCTPIFVPNAPSLSGLFQDVIHKAGLQPKDISLVEAHGTGTPVGDPAEYESILRVMGGKSVRSTPMPIGSIKGLIGHTECVSGVMALIKVLLLLRHNTIPRQASFTKLSPGIKASEDDMLKIVTETTSWKADYRRAALINNYGASGSNASMVVADPPRAQRQLTAGSDRLARAFWITGLDDRSLRDYCGIMFRSSTVEELDQTLERFVAGSAQVVSTAKKPPRPVILCFGGQISRTVHLEKSIYDNNLLLRKHLDHCHSVLRTRGLPGLYPTIFENQPVDDPVHLQTMLFALQYSLAQCWLDCGANVAAVTGHSFGELTALCVAGHVSLEDSLRIVAARAKIIKTSWGADPGVMMAIEGDLALVQKVLLQAAEECVGEKPAAIACYNGPSSFTLAGSTIAMAVVAEHIKAAGGLRSKTLSVSNAFHSSLVDPLIEQLEQIAVGVAFKKAKIRWERATEQPPTSDIGPKFFATHMRDAVFANHAFQRLHKEYPAAIWIEAGSNSTITKMASKALGNPTSSCFQSLDLTKPDSLADTFVSVWKEGLNVGDWANHPIQASLYDLILLPPYQFEKSRHWLDLKRPEKAIEQPAANQDTANESLPTSLFTLIGFQDDAKRHARFRINTNIKQYEDLVLGHVITQTAAICPATVEVDIAIEALFSLRPDLDASNMQPEIHDVENQAPICVNPARSVWLDLKATDSGMCSWAWAITSEDCLDILSCSEPDDVIQGRNMYKVFSEIVDYSLPYQGLQKLVGKGQTSAGRVVKKRSQETWLDPHLSDCFSQVGGFWVNCMTDRSPSDIYIAAGFESWIRRPQETGIATEETADALSVWDVMACHHQVSEKAYTTDIFIFDAVSGRMHEVILGIRYARIPKIAMIKTLHRFAADGAVSTKQGQPSAPPAPQQALSRPSLEHQSFSTILSDVNHGTPDTNALTKNTVNDIGAPGSKILSSVVEILIELSGLEADAIKPAMQLGDIGIDSLMGMEMAHELEGRFQCTFDMDQLAQLMTVQDVVDCVCSTLGITTASSSGVDTPESDKEDYIGYSGSSLSTPGFAKSPGDSSMTSLSDLGTVTPEPKEEKVASDGLTLSASTVLEAFGEVKLLTDNFIADYGCAGYIDTINPKQTQLCVALTVEAFETLGCPIRSAKPGTRLERIPHAAQHKHLVRYLYEMLEADARLIDIDGEHITRTAVSAPTQSSKAILETLVAAYPNHNFANRLAYYCGSKLVDILSGQLDGVRLIFGSDEGRDLVSGLYGDSLLNKLSYKLMEDVLRRLVSKLPPNSGPLKILEMGAGTGGTTKYLAPLLAELGVPVEYTFTDLAPSFVAAARKKFKAYPFMKFRAHDIEAVPADDLIGSQHLIVASNAVHATHSLTRSLGNIRKALRPDGFLMMLEMTETLRWVDIIFGILEGWWFFDDGRSHALSHQTRWEKELHSVGYGHVDWTDGRLPENKIQRVIIAMASGEQSYRRPLPELQVAAIDTSDLEARRAAVDAYVNKYTAGFTVKPAQTTSAATVDEGKHVIVTGGTGSVGSHLVAHLLALPDVRKVTCLNRPSRGSDAASRQNSAFITRRIPVDPTLASSNFEVFATDLTKPLLGLAQTEYTTLTRSATHIVHNAWPMSGNRPVNGFESQFRVMRNLLDFSSAIMSATNRVVTFQFVSSIAVVGHQPLHTKNSVVLEDRVDIDSVLPNGYGDAKYVCERMLDETLHLYPSSFRAMSVRLGQVAGCSSTGYWNSLEHFPLLVKSSQTLGCLPDFDNVLSWTPVELVAGTLGDLLRNNDAGGSAEPIYHIDNPVRQPWKEMVGDVLAPELGIPQRNIVPFEEWVRLVRRFVGSVEKDNPAFKLIDFLEESFERMSCGGLLLDPEKSRQRSETLTGVGPVTEQVTRRYIQYWRDTGFLKA